MLSIAQLEDICSNPITVAAFLQEHGILSSNFYCDDCRAWMDVELDSTRSDNILMRCATCSKSLSIRHSSVLYKSKLTLKQFVYFAYFWVLKISCDQMCIILALSKPTVIKYMKLFRRVCSLQLLRMDMRVGGPGTIVQIDESVIYRPKYHRGHALFETQKWIFGIYEPHCKKGLILFVPDRSAATLLPLIMRFILPGSEIHSDQWAAYRGISDLPVEPAYVHRTVNHSLHFVDPVTDVHTNNVEAFWSSVKKKFKMMNGANRQLTGSYLDEQVYRGRFSQSGGDIFTTFLDHLGDMSTFE
jgi:transposase-like protein